MRVWLPCVKCFATVWFGFASVAGVGAKPPELPNRPLIEFKVPLPTSNQSSTWGAIKQLYR